MTDKRECSRKIRRRAILEAAKALFFEKQYHSTTVDEIAQHAGLSKRTLYKYFPSKQTIFIHVFDEILQKLHQELSRCAGQDLPADQLLLALFSTLFTFTKKYEKFMRLFWVLDTDEFDGVIPDELIKRMRIWTKALFDILNKVAVKCRQDGLIVDSDPTILIHLISAMNKGIFVHANKENKLNIAEIDPEILYNKFIELISCGLFHPSGKRPENWTGKEAEVR